MSVYPSVNFGGEKDFPSIGLHSYASDVRCSLFCESLVLGTSQGQL